MSGSKRRSSAEYSVGYKKPPKETRFRRGTSGNPKGRPRGRKNVMSLFQQLIDERVTVKEGGKSLRVSKLEAMLRNLIIKAMQGDASALKIVMLLVQQCDLEIPPDQKIIVEFVRSLNRDIPRLE